VTGSAGFIGSHLAERLIQEGAEVTALTRYNSSNSAGFLDQFEDSVRDQIKVVAGDVTDCQLVTDLVSTADVVFHLAALISVPYSYEVPRMFYEVNTGGTLNVLEAAREADNVRVIHTSSSEVYGTPEVVPITESHPLRAQSPYAASKIAADKFVESFFHSFGSRVTTVRPFNTYGPRQSTRAIIPTVLSQAIGGGGTIRVGSLWPRRDMTYVSDTVDGFVKAAQRDESIGETIQLGTGDDVSIAEIIEEACAALGVGPEIVSESQRQRPEASEVVRLISDNSRAKEVLGWTPQVDLKTGLLQTSDWIRSRIDDIQVGEYVV
jgi:NAD dependent epimerase/dehydratase